MNLRGALRRSGILYHDKSSDPHEVLINCPFCASRGESPDTRFRCAINVAKNKGNCKNCGWVANSEAIEQVQKQLSLDAARGTWDFADDAPVEKIEKEPEYGPPEGYIPLAGYAAHPGIAEDEVDPIGQAIRYVGQRGISWQQVERHAIGACLHGRYHHRIIFPVFIRDAKGKKVWRGFVSRAWSSALEPKVLNASCSMPLYNAPLSLVLHMPFNFEPIPELRSCALLGHSMTPEQRMQITNSSGPGMVISEGVIKALAIERVVSGVVKTGCHTILFPDPDAQGLSGFLKVAWALSTTMPVRFAYPFPKLQADEMCESQIRKAIDGAVSFTPFLELEIRQEIESRRRTYFQYRDVE